jgi:hypothetical protein
VTAKKKADDEPAITIERINELVGVIVPRPGCATENGEAVALALVELTKMVAGEGFSFSGDIDSGLGAAYYVARGAFERTGSFEDALEDWQDNTVEAALKKGGKP